MKPIVTWVLIADGAQARVFRHAGPGKGLAAVEGLRFEEEHLQARDIVTDRPGRAAGPSGGTGGAMDYSADPVRVRETRFVKSVTELLDRKCLEGAFDRLVIAAAPTALGVIRDAMTDRLRQALLAEMPKDLTNVPVPQLQRHFKDLLAV